MTEITKVIALKTALYVVVGRVGAGVYFFKVYVLDTFDSTVSVTQGNGKV